VVSSFSPTWFSFFLRPIAPAQTELEVAFVCRHLPQPNYNTAPDLCCGFSNGTKALPLPRF
jgi:hypothetical protein